MVNSYYVILITCAINCAFLSLLFCHDVCVQMSDVGVISHLRLTILPDGGVMRLRAFGLKEQGQQSRL